MLNVFSSGLLSTDCLACTPPESASCVCTRYTGMCMLNVLH